MSRVVSYVPRALFFLAGVAVAAVTLPRRERQSVDNSAAEELKQAISILEAKLEARIQSSESIGWARLAEVETKLEQHTAKLADVPSTTQIVNAMEQLFSRTMASLDERLTTQARSIEVLKTTVSQTDILLERVLESLDSLQGISEPPGFREEPQLSRPAV